MKLQEDLEVDLVTISEIDSIPDSEEMSTGAIQPASHQCLSFQELEASLVKLMSQTILLSSSQ